MKLSVNRRTSNHGFTIVELAVVIIVIAVLAAITISSFKAVQDRAKNSQTSAAAEQWLKALKIYQVRNGGLPTSSSCLGANYNYNSDGAGSTGIGQCRQDSSSYGITSDTAFAAALSPYISGNPTPAMITAKNSATSWYRGLYYYVGAGNQARLDMTMTPASGGCPDRLADVSLNTFSRTLDSNYLCIYIIGNTTSF